MKITQKQRSRIIVITNLCWQDATKKRSELVYDYDVASISELDDEEANGVIMELLISDEYNSLLRQRAKVKGILENLGYNTSYKIDKFLIESPNIHTKKRLDYIPLWELPKVITSLEKISEHKENKMRSQMRVSHRR